MKAGECQSSYSLTRMRLKVVLLRNVMVSIEWDNLTKYGGIFHQTKAQRMMGCNYPYITYTDLSDLGYKMALWFYLAHLVIYAAL